MPRAIRHSRPASAVRANSSHESSEPVTVYLPVRRPSDIGRLVVQTGDTDDSTSVTVESITFLSPRRE